MIERMMELQKEFKQLYNESGLVSISDDYIQVDAAFMLEHFPVIRVRKRDKRWLEMTAEKDGMKFIALEWKGKGLMV